MLDDFLIRAMAAGIGVAVIAGPLGCFIVWRRMAYFGDTMAHGALLGVALGLALDIGPTVAVVAVGAALALLLSAFQGQKRLAGDTLLGIFSHSSLAIGLVALGVMEDVRVDLMGYLFGDILAVGMGDLAWIWGGGLSALAVLVALWRPLVAMTVHEELAAAEGVAVAPLRLALMLAVALSVAVAMKIIGVLLITALLIIPAATARRFAPTPEVMAVLAVLVGMVSVGLGLLASLEWDSPAGPSVVAAAAALFALSQVLGRLFGRR